MSQINLLAFSIVHPNPADTVAEPRHSTHKSWERNPKMVWGVG